MIAGLCISWHILKMVLFTDSYHCTGSRSLSNTCFQQFGNFSEKCHNLCIGVDFEQVLPEKRGRKVNARTQALFSNKLSPLFLRHLQTLLSLQHFVRELSSLRRMETLLSKGVSTLLQSPFLQQPSARSQGFVQSYPWQP